VNDVDRDDGRPKVDLAAEVARALFENDGEGSYAAFQKVLRKGSPYAFQMLSDRAFGKLKETHAIEHSVYKDMSDKDHETKIKELEQSLGYRRGISKGSVSRGSGLALLLPRDRRPFLSIQTTPWP